MLSIETVVSKRKLRGPRTALHFIAAVVAMASLSLPAHADRRGRDDKKSCRNVPAELEFHSESSGTLSVSLDEIVPAQLQGLIRTDRDALTGVWIADIDLFTNVNPLACEIPKAGNCSGALEGACPGPSAAPSEPIFQCGNSFYWTNNTFALYELKGGSLYALNFWRIWDQAEYPTVEALRAARPPFLAGGYVFQNGVRNEDETFFMTSSVGEIVTVGSSTGASPQLADKISMVGSIHDSNVGQVLLSNTRTDTALSIIYAPRSPREAVWKLNLRRVRKCPDSATFQDLVFPPKRKIRIEDDD